MGHIWEATNSQVENDQTQKTVPFTDMLLEYNIGICF